MDNLQLQANIEAQMNALATLFTKEVRLTLIARLPGNDKADLILTVDEPDELAKVIERWKAGSLNLQNKGWLGKCFSAWVPYV